MADREDETDDLAAAPRHDTLLRRVARPVSPPSALLEPGSGIGERYEIVKPIGAGGMGEVYLARDLTLERDVAIKLHREGHAVERLRREAIAMARLAHPNVVTVFEVGELAGRAYVAMEYVPGTTLRGWLAERPRRPREILAMLCAIGHGLAAAHDAGIVHRDFKPDNVLIGRDGRARVGDFGLAREAGARTDDERGHAGSELAAGLTETGTVMGTPAYMAPEQANGEPVDARADQYAFCVVAWEALYGERPVAGVVANRSGRVPQALARGLAVAPAARHATMHALLAELADRKPWAALAAGTGVLALGTVAIWQLTADDPATCAGAGDEIATLDTSISARLPALASARIGAFVAGYRSSAAGACRAKLDGTWSDEVARRASTCLALQRQVAAGLLAPGGFAGTPADAALRTSMLPDPAACRDAVRLEARPRTASDAAVATRATLEVADRELAQHRLEPVARAIAQVRALPVASDPFVAARLALVRGGAAVAGHDVLAGQALLVEAHTAARATGDAETTLDAGAALISTTGLVRRDAASVERWIATAIGDAERLAPHAPEAAARVYLAAARVARELRELDDEGPFEASTAAIVRGAGWVAKALALVGETQVSWPRIEGLHLRGLFHAAGGRADDALGDLGRASTLARELYGADHPLVAELSGETIVDLLAIGRADDAAAAARETSRILAVHHQVSSLALARARRGLGLGRLERGDRARGIEQLVLARAQLPLSTERALLDNQLALALIDDQRPAEALAPLLEALSLQETALDPTHADLAVTHYNLAVALRDHGQLADALDHATRAARQFEARPASHRHILARALCAEIANRAGDHAAALAWTTHAIIATATGEPETLAWPRLERARALLATGGDRAEARRLLAQARTIWSALDRTQRLAEIDQLVRTSRLRPL